MRHARLSERSSARPCTTEEKRTNNSVAQAQQQQQGRRTNAPTNNMEEGASRCHRHHHGTGGRAWERAGDRVTDIIARNGTRPRRASVTRRRARTIILFFSCSSAQREQQEHCLSVKGGERERTQRTTTTTEGEQKLAKKLSYVQACRRVHATHAQPTSGIITGPGNNHHARTAGGAHDNGIATHGGGAQNEPHFGAPFVLAASERLNKVVPLLSTLWRCCWPNTNNEHERVQSISLGRRITSF